MIPITEHLRATATYTYIPCEELALTDYETHHFSLSFMKDERLIDEYTYDKVIHPDKYGSLADPEIDFDIKLKVLRSIRPTIKALFTKTNLTPEEQLAVMDKWTEIQTAILNMPDSRGL